MKKINRIILLLLTITCLVACDKSNFEETNIVPTHVYQITNFKNNNPYYKLTVYDEVKSLITWKTSVSASANYQIIDLQDNSTDAEYSLSFKTENEEKITQLNPETNEMEEVTISKVTNYSITALRTSTTVGIPAIGTIVITDSDNKVTSYDVKVAEDYKYKENK